MIDRRAFLGGVLLSLAGAAVARAGRLLLPAAPIGAPLDLSGELIGALESSPFVYVSPLRSDGSESTCHGEVWYGWIDGAVVLTTGRDTWKARSLAKGLDRARIWVGDYGRWKRLIGSNEAFRDGPSFEAVAARADDPELLDRLLEIYERKYPDEIGRWSDRMRAGHASGERVLIRYTPVA